MDWKYPLSEPFLDKEEQHAALDTIQSGWLSMGPKTEEFESAFAAKMECRHAIAVSNGTAALHLAFLALEIGEGDEVIQPAINFVAAANMTCAVGAQPVFSDLISLVEPTIDPAQVKAAINQKTRALVVMHYGGYPCHMRELAEICVENKIHLIEDACHGVGYRDPEAGNKFLGTIGDIGCFSFFANKNLTTGEGGMITTNSDQLAARVRNLRSHGMTTVTWDRHKGHASSYDVIANGFNYRIDDLRSSIGLVQLRKLDAGNQKRRQLAALYASMFSEQGRSDVEYIFGASPANGAGHLAAVILPARSRDRAREYLAAAGIQSSMHYPSIDRLSAFSESCNNQPLQVTHEFASRQITLPLYPGLTEEGVEEICETLEQALSE